MRYQTAISLVFAALATTAGAAELYRWVDAQGVVHYDDKYHPQAKVVIVTSSNGPGADATALARAEDCRRKKADLESYRGATSLQQEDALGNIKTFTEAERLKFLEKQEGVVKAACGPAPAPAPASAAATAPP